MLFANLSFKPGTDCSMKNQVSLQDLSVVECVFRYICIFNLKWNFYSKYMQLFKLQSTITQVLQPYKVKFFQVYVNSIAINQDIQ